MTTRFFDNLREKNKLVAFISKFSNSIFFPILFAVVCAFSGVHGKAVYVPCFIFLAFISVLAGLFSKDLKVFIVPMILLYYALGFDVADGYYTQDAPVLAFEEIAIIPLIICAAVIIATLIFRLITDGHIKDLFLRRGIFFWGIVCIGGAFILGGTFSAHWDWKSVLFGIIISLFMLLFYALFTIILAQAKDGIAYLCKVTVCLGFVALFQIATVSYRLFLHDNLVNEYAIGNFINRGMLSLSWGFATIVGAVFVLALCAALYLMRTRRFPILSFLSACCFLMATFAINTRSAFFCGLMIFIVGVIFCCVGKNNKNKKINTICVLSALGVGIIVIVIFCLTNMDHLRALFDKIMQFMRFEVHDSIDDKWNYLFSQRFDYWGQGLNNFISAPVFGSGFTSLTPRGLNFFDTMYEIFRMMNHCIFIQFLGSTGIVGLVAFLIHLKHILEVAVRRFTLNRLLILAVPIAILGMSLVDNFFFIPNFIIIYAAFLAAAEIDLEQTREKHLKNLKKIEKGKKPRVVFTYVEAGKGHITATQNVYDEFCKKYGDRAEVIQSRFFTETKNEDLEKTEKLFSRTVKDQNRSHIYSILCKIGNVLAGDTFALYVLLKLTLSGRKTNPHAVKHIEELDADLIYSAHWAIPFYANQIKGPRPYVVTFCPDVYSNGAFNVDCNNFVISTKEGYDQLQHFRMYAGGNVQYVPYPLRQMTEEYRSREKKLECRQNLGIPGNEFVAVLCDGGYGMAKLEKTVNHLLKSKEKMTIIALCGTNHTLYERLCKRQDKVPEHIRLIPVDFTDKMLDYLACGDIFVGKGGANAITEPASIGVPIIITKCITYIERGTKRYFVRHVKGAMYIPSSRAAAKKIRKIIKNPSILDKYKENLSAYNQRVYDPEAFADLLWKRVCEMQESDGE